jgi:hypothetical protein
LLSSRKRYWSGDLSSSFQSVSLLLLAKAVQALLVTVKPITAGILAAVEFRGMLAILALAAVCFIAGLIVRTEPGLWAKNAVE